MSTNSYDHACECVDMYGMDDVLESIASLCGSRGSYDRDGNDRDGDEVSIAWEMAKSYIQDAIGKVQEAEQLELDNKGSETDDAPDDDVLPD